jgi:hypothetical protein
MITESAKLIHYMEAQPGMLHFRASLGVAACNTDGKIRWLQNALFSTSQAYRLHIRGRTQRSPSA